MNGESRDGYGDRDRGRRSAVSVHNEVIEVMQEEGIDISDRTPREITPADLEDADYVVTMGCSVD